MHATRTTNPAIRAAINFFDLLTVDYRKRDFLVRFWDGTEWSRSQSPRFRLTLNHPSSLKRIFTDPSELGLGEAYISGDFEMEGDLDAAFDFGDFLVNHHFSIPAKLKLAAFRAQLPGTRQKTSPMARLEGAVHSRGRDRSAIAFHYDVSNDFYKLWLDKSMVYSCAYFQSTEMGIEEAQASKLDYICRKLRLKRGDQLLDIGCGWGGLIIHAVKNFGVRAFGITLSTPQAEYVREQTRFEGIADRCNVEVCDYRDLDPPQEYDKIVSIGMFEHVGTTLLPAYFRHAWEMLRPGGVFLNHGIAASATYGRSGPSFIDRYVFPDGELVPINLALKVAEETGFEVRDLENLREHYALTLRQWVRRLDSNANMARALVGELRYRIWRLYMAGSAYAFSKGRLGLHQLLLIKPDHGKSNLPLTRTDWYVS